MLLWRLRFYVLQFNIFHLFIGLFCNFNIKAIIIANINFFPYDSNQSQTLTQISLHLRLLIGLNLVVNRDIRRITICWIIFAHKTKITYPMDNF